MIDIKKSLESLALLFAGALASVIGGLFFRPPVCSKYLWSLSAIVVILIFYGSGMISRMCHSYNLRARKGSWLVVPKVGILNDMGWDLENKEIYSWTDVHPEEWKKEIERQAEKNKTRIKVELVNTKKNFDPYIIILNPYGGVYPERNLKNFETLNKIFNYVNEGGVFVNVADVPGYWVYNPLLKRMLDATPPIYGIDKTSGGEILIKPIRPFQLTPFMEKLGLQVLNIENSKLSEWNVEFKEKINRAAKEIGRIKVHRAVVVERNVDPIMKPKRLERIDVTPLFFVNYGEGKFLISLIFENCNQNSKIKEVLAGIITALINPKETVSEKDLKKE